MILLNGLSPSREGKVSIGEEKGPLYGPRSLVDRPSEPLLLIVACWLSLGLKGEAREALGVILCVYWTVPTAVVSPASSRILKGKDSYQSQATDKIKTHLTEAPEHVQSALRPTRGSAHLSGTLALCRTPCQNRRIA